MSGVAKVDTAVVRVLPAPTKASVWPFSMVQVAEPDSQVRRSE